MYVPCGRADIYPDVHVPNRPVEPGHLQPGLDPSEITASLESSLLTGSCDLSLELWRQLRNDPTALCLCRI